MRQKQCGSASFRYASRCEVSGRREPVSTPAGTPPSRRYDAEHVSDLGLESAPDGVILEKTREENRVLISADTDFGTLLAESRARLPSVILIRRTSARRAFHLARLIAANLPGLAEALESGCVVVFDAERVRVRQLPLI